MQSLCVLGSTGSIGNNTLDLVRQHPERYRVYALAANRQVDLMLSQCREFRPDFAAMNDEKAALALAEAFAAEGIKTEVLQGEQGLKAIAAAEEVDTVVAAIVGAAGLPATMKAVEAGKRILLANKEALVMSGALFTRAASASGATILPVDSEHNAIFQCLPQDFSSFDQAGINKIILTGSGGPFRTKAPQELVHVSPEEACAHPNWDMGRKISVDSATMMNKGLEFIEACWLFNARPEQIQVVVHPQSIIHSMVEYADGSVLAQLGHPDMRTPIAHCLAWPERITSGVEPLDFYRMSTLEFAEPDFERFPCLRLAIDAVRRGGDAPAALNAANEVAVDSFLNGDIAFTHIAMVIAKVMEAWNLSEPKSLDDVIEADFRGRELAERQVSAFKQAGLTSGGPD